MPMSDTPAEQENSNDSSPLGKRIESICYEIGWDEAAKRADKSVKQLRRYVHGGDPPFSVLNKLAIASGVSIEWLATGEGPMRREEAAATGAASSSAALAKVTPTTSQTLDGRLMGLCFEGVRRTYKEASARIDDRSAGELATRLYADVMAAAEGEPDQETARRAALRVALRQLDRELRTPPEASSSKHSA